LWGGGGVFEALPWHSMACTSGVSTAAAATAIATAANAANQKAFKLVQKPGLTLVDIAVGKRTVRYAGAAAATAAAATAAAALLM